MIQGIHAMYYSSESEALRVFLRDKLGLPHVDAGGGWLIFAVPGAEIGCHPLASADAKPSTGLSFYCDDIERTVAELRERGVEFVDAITDFGWGRGIHFAMSGDLRGQLYEPRHAQPSAR
jgi:hypothetical protein